MPIHSNHYPYPSRRVTTYASNGMVATSHPLAAQVGLSILQQGGNAIDAAVATAAALTVLEPMSNGIGGDAFALVWNNGKLHGLNASGPAPQLLTLQAMQGAGYAEMPFNGFAPVTVPGAPAAWVALNTRFGSLPLEDVMSPAIRYAETGYPVSPAMAYTWHQAAARYNDHVSDPAFQSWFETFAPGGRTPRAGEIWRSTGHAASLKAIAETAAGAFYSGELAQQIDQFSQMHGGYLRGDDLSSYQPEWVDPVSIRYRGYDVWEMPPNGHGIVALMALNILKGFDFSYRESTETYHRQIEAIKLAYADGRHYIADPRCMTVSTADLLADPYAAQRRAMIEETALMPAPGQPPRSDTVYLTTADRQGNMVSFIQSNYTWFGSGIVIPGTGIALQNRGNNFSLDPAHPNCLAPGKKPYHTIIPGFLTKDGEAVCAFGVVGGFMQPQGHVQMVTNAVDFHLNPQAALDAPRWQWIADKTVELEPTVAPHIAEGLQQRGHDVRYALNGSSFGRGQIIWRQPHGVLVGASEPRTDGQVAAW